jgi:hypothetical protein
MSPVPARHVGGEWLVSPVLVCVSISFTNTSQDMLTLSW